MPLESCLFLCCLQQHTAVCLPRESARRKAAAGKRALKITQVRARESSARLYKSTAYEMTNLDVGNRLFDKSRQPMPLESCLFLCCLQQHTAVCLPRESARRKAAAGKRALKFTQVRAGGYVAHIYKSTGHELTNL